MQSEISVSGNDLPRIYRTNAGARRFANTFLFFFAGLFLFLTVLDVAGRRHRSGPLGNLIFMDVAVALFVAGIGSGYNKRVILHRDSIEVVGWFYSRRLSFAEIRGRLTTGSSRLPYGYAHIFVPTDSNKRKLALPPYLHSDQFFRDWIKTIPQVSR